MTRKENAGILLYRLGTPGPEVFLVHPGGPFWANRDDGAWSIPKGELEADEEPFAVACREFEEETGTPLVAVSARELPPIRQAKGKRVRAWAVEGEIDAAALSSNTFTLEWPPRSGRTATFPEVDRGGWFELSVARRKLLAAQMPLLDALEALLDGE